MKAKLTLTQNALRKIQALVAVNSKEVGFHGIVERPVKENKLSFKLSEIYVYPQTVTEASIDCDDIEFANWQAEFMMAHPEEYNKLRLHGHSHVTMRTTPSYTDLALQKDIAAQLNAGDFYIFIIVNKQQKIWGRVYIKEKGILSEYDIALSYESYKDWADAQTIKYVKGEETWIYENVHHSLIQ